MSENDERRMVLDLLSNADAAIITAVDSEGFPQSRTMFNLRNKEMFPKLIPLFAKHDDDFMIIFTTNTSSTKMKAIRNNPKVAIHYYIQNQWQSVMFSGEIQIVEDLKFKKDIWHDGWEKYYPKGYDDPDHTVLRLYPKYARGWNQSHTYQFEIG